MLESVEVVKVDNDVVSDVWVRVVEDRVDVVKVGVVLLVPSVVVSVVLLIVDDVSVVSVCVVLVAVVQVAVVGSGGRVHTHTSSESFVASQFSERLPIK